METLKRFSVEDFHDLDESTQAIVHAWILEKDLVRQNIVMIMQSENPGKILLAGLCVDENDDNYMDTVIKGEIEDDFPWDPVTKSLLEVAKTKSES